MEAERSRPGTASPQDWENLVKTLADLARALASLFQTVPEFLGFLAGSWLIYLGLKVLGYL